MNDAKIKITAIVCTYNRCQMLTKVLNDLAVQKLPESVEWEILVIDNNSKDQTPQAVEKFREMYPGRIRYVFEPQPGLSCARNTGIREARGDVLAFTDDDVSVEPTWLANLTASMHDLQYAGAGGRVVPEWPCKPPNWLPRDGMYSLAAIVVFDLGDKPGELTETPFGANMAFRKDIFEKYGGFRTDLGHIGGKLVGHEDSEFGHRLLDAGEKLRYEPSSVVYHPVTQERMQKKYFLKYRFDAGRGDVRQLGIAAGTKYYLFGVPLYLFRRLAVWTLRWLVAFQPHRRFERKLKVWAISGQIAECYHRSFENQSQPSVS